jgi:ATP adenylyltransferase
MRGSRVKFSELVGARAALAGGMATVYTDLCNCCREIRETGPMIQPMQHLWAPWRMEFIKGPKPSGCFFCEAAAADPSDDADHLVLARSDLALVILNRYPYNNGHLMVAPKAHLANLEDLPPATAHDVIALTQRSLRVLRQVLAPQGFNLGINAGKIAGAGVADHVHQHVVPRWDGDTNFMPVTADTKVLAESLAVSYQELRAGFDRLP